ncbi:hypothetical protein D3C81_1630850 [compost metagenome]
MFKAFRGVTYKSFTPLRALPSRAVSPASRTIRSRQGRRAARVLPEPVGAAISVLCPAAILTHASCCTRVGEPKDCLNQASITG